MFERHLDPKLGDMRIDTIDLGVVNALRAELRTAIGRRGKPLSEKTRANILGVLATALRYAESAGVIERAPPIKVKAVALPPIECWNLDEYGRLIVAAMREGEPWATAVLLAGECGLRIGEVLGLEWPDLDLVANTITIVQQVRQGVEGPPKGGKPRTVPMTARLAAHLRSVPRIHVGRVVAHEGAAVGEGEAAHSLRRICRTAGLPERVWHRAAPLVRHVRGVARGEPAAPTTLARALHAEHDPPVHPLRGGAYVAAARGSPDRGRGATTSGPASHGAAWRASDRRAAWQRRANRQTPRW